jgi:hypothetical protein
VAFEHISGERDVRCGCDEDVRGYGQVYGQLFGEGKGGGNYVQTTPKWIFVNNSAIGRAWFGAVPKVKVYILLII